MQPNRPISAAKKRELRSLAKPVIVGTCVPVQSLFEYVEAGDTLEEFLHQCPSVLREQALDALDYACDQMMAGARFLDESIPVDFAKPACAGGP
jgi:uncharacterized protein (DUF433 family)